MPFADEWDEAGAIPSELWPKAAEVGLLGLGYPEQFGGTSADSWHSWIVNEELSRVGVGVSAHHSWFMALVFLR
ncbi:MAG: hypothetical protein CM15mP74_18240 [Halieaceae bacterium]|nr:MAG: hypothetical protein CM15mP74_18240 [Halieaceae bacterium]